MRSIIRNHLVILPQARQLLGVLDRLIQVTNLVDQPILFGLVGGKNAAVRSNAGERHLLGLSIPLQERMAFVIGGWNFLIDDVFVREFPLELGTALLDDGDELVIGVA